MLDHARFSVSYFKAEVSNKPKRPPRVRPSRAKALPPATPPLYMATIKRELMKQIKEDLVEALSTKRTHQVVREERNQGKKEKIKSLSV